MQAVVCRSPCCDEFCIEIRRDSNPRGSNPAFQRPLALITRPLVYIRLVSRMDFHDMWWKTIRYQSHVHDWPSGQGQGPLESRGCSHAGSNPCVSQCKIHHEFLFLTHMNRIQGTCCMLLSRRHQSPDAVRSRNPSKSTLTHCRCGVAQSSFDHLRWCRPHPACLWFALETWPRSLSIKESYFRASFLIVVSPLIYLLPFRNGSGTRIVKTYHGRNRNCPEQICLQICSERS